MMVHVSDMEGFMDPIKTGVHRACGKSEEQNDTQHFVNNVEFRKAELPN